MTQDYLLIITMCYSYMYKDTHDTLKWYLEHLLYICIDLDVILDCWTSEVIVGNQTLLPR